VTPEELYRKYGPMVHRRCRTLLRDDAAAWDAHQDVFVQVLRHSSRLELERPSSLLFRMATNVCLNKMRTRRRKPEEPGDELFERIAGAPETDGRTVATQLLDVLFQREPESTRTIAVLHLLDGMTLEEVAGEVGLSVSGVRKRLRTLKEHLHELEAV
jgi:RNA polymerase sigma-70 factor (ECF subfamily)